jgi:hypothetical protein
MATLENVRGESFQVDPSSALNLLLQTFGTGPQRAQRAEAKRLTDIIAQPTGRELGPAEQVAQAVGGPGVVPETAGPTAQDKQAALVRLSGINPQMAQSIRQTIQFGDKQEALKLAQEVDKGVRMATLVNQGKTFQEKRQNLMQLAQAKAAAGEDTGRILELRSMPESKLNLELQRMLVAGADSKTLLTPPAQVRQQLDAQGNPTGAQETVSTDFLGRETVTAVAKSGVPAGFDDITDAQGNVIGQENVVTGEKKFFTAAQRGLPGRGTPQAKEPFFTQEPVLDPQGNPVLDAEGNPQTATFQNITEFDPNQPKGKRFSVTKMDVNGEVISKTTGLTASQASKLKTKTAKETAQAVAGVELEEKPKIERAVKLSGAQIRAETKRVDDALESLEALPNLIRARELLKTIKTGGIDAAKLRFKQFAGIEGADEGELSQNLGVAVLSQLRATFGAAFTEGEGRRLERLQAGFGKSNAANIRLMGNAIQIIERAAKRGRRAAGRLKDEVAIEEIDRALKFRLKPPGKQSTQKAAPKSGTIGRFKFRTK